MWIGWRQHVTARDKLRLDLYDRRVAVYKALMSSVSKITAVARADLQDVQEIGATVAQARFLFGTDVLSFGEQLRRRAIEYRRIGLSREIPKKSDRALCSGACRFGALRLVLKPI